jgi:hypothetical protein
MSEMNALISTMALEKCPALVLNADYRPLSYYPLSLWSWQDAVRAIFRESVVVVSEYERIVRSPTKELRLPSVLALKEFVPAAHHPAFTRYNVFLRDEWQCQYCAHAFQDTGVDVRSRDPAVTGRTDSLGQYRHGLSGL